jgi:hypothetical protein
MGLSVQRGAGLGPAPTRPSRLSRARWACRRSDPRGLTSPDPIG